MLSKISLIRQLSVILILNKHHLNDFQDLYLKLHIY